jgi:hypothetical protein
VNACIVMRPPRDDMTGSNPILRSILLGLLTCAACTGCRARSAERKAPSGGCLNAIEKSQNGEYRGFITSGREEQAFIPCDCEDIWWVEYDRGAVGQVNGARRNARCYETFDNPACQEWTYAEVSGTLSPAGQYGHMGWYSRELRVNQVGRLSQDVPATCTIRRITRR